MANSWLKRTGQTWKVVVFGVLVVVGLALFALFLAAVNEKIQGEMAFAFTFMGAGFGALFWLATAIRCSQCGARPAWHLMRTAPHGSWFVQLLALDRCPSCGK